MRFRTPRRWGLIYKILAVTFTVSAAIWFVIDDYQSQQLQKMFLDKAYAELRQGAADDRRLFDQYSQAHFRSVKLITGQKRFHDFIETMRPVEPSRVMQVSHLSQLPSWMPRPSVMRTFYRARYALLFDENGFVHSAYHHTHEHGGAEKLPQDLLKSKSILRKLSHNQAYLTMVAKVPFLISSERVKTKKGYITLALVSPIDNEFLAEAASSQNHRTIITLVDKHAAYIVASSNIDVIPVGSRIDDLESDYIMLRKSFFDYGASDINLGFTSFASLAEVNRTTGDIQRTSNYQRATIVLVMMSTFLVIMIFFVRRVMALGQEVNQISRKVFGRDLDEGAGGDELTVLGRQLSSLAREVIDSRNKLHAEVVVATKMASDLEARSAMLAVTNETLKNEITERKKSEVEREKLNKQLQQAQKMDAIGKITGGVAHDFNNILASILGFSELAEMKFGEHEKSGKLSNYLSEISTAGGRGRDLVSSMMAFSRGESGEKRTILLEEEVEGIVTMLRPTISSSIDINVSVLDKGVCINVDPVGLQQAIINLIINARDVMPFEKGAIYITLRRVKLAPSVCKSCHETIDGSFIELRVCDTGSGISSEAMPHIFEPFFTTKEVGKGSGMGLSVTHGFLHANNGHVLVESKPDEGACFRLLFTPESEQELSELEDVSDENNTHAVSHGHIMVVDDEAFLTRYLRELLELKGYVVEAFNDPVDALNCYTNNPDEFDLIITDQTMPKLTGIELTEKIHKLNPEMPVVMCTGYSAKTDALSAKEHGVSEFLPKPVNSRELLATVDRLLIDSTRRQ